MVQEQPIENTPVTVKLAERLQRVMRGGRWISTGRLPSMRKLAGEFGVSVATVQSAVQILHEQGLVDRQDRRGIFINLNRFRTRRSSQVALVVPFPESAVDQSQMHAFMHHLSFSHENNWDAVISRSFEQTLRAHRLDLVALPVSVDRRGVVASVTERLDRFGAPLAGVFTFGGSLTSELARVLDERDLPWVTVNPPTQRSVYNFVAADNLHGGKRVGRCLAGMGVRSVLVLCRSLASFSTDVEKVLGLYQGFLERDAPADQIVLRCVSVPDETAGYRQTKAYLAESARPPQVIFAISDDLAAGAIHALREAGLKAPEDIGVIGATGLKLYEHTELPLTTLAQPMEEMGRQAAEMLTFMISEGVRRMVGRRIPGPLLFRRSIDVPEHLRQEAETDYHNACLELQNAVDDTVEATLRPSRPANGVSEAI